MSSKMIAKAQPHLGKALPWVLLTKDGWGYFQLIFSNALKEMSFPYWKPPCGRLREPHSCPAAPQLPLPGVYKSESGKRQGAKDGTCWGQGWISPQFHGS